jgi:hypothetical protein
VRRDANEEKTIISYFVPKTGAYDIQAIRDWLKAKLPAYAVPSGACGCMEMALQTKFYLWSSNATKEVDNLTGTFEIAVSAHQLQYST